jgi:hypothetical protein
VYGERIPQKAELVYSAQLASLNITWVYEVDLGSSPQHATVFLRTEIEQPVAHPAALPGESFALLVSSEQDGVSNVYRADLSGFTPLASSPTFDGQPAAGATGWEPDPEASLLWLQAHEH